VCARARARARALAVDYIIKSYKLSVV